MPRCFAISSAFFRLSPVRMMIFFFFFFFNDTATTEIYTLSLHDALPIWVFTDYQTFSSRTPCCSFTTDFHSFYRMDPPELQHYRGLVSQPFTPLAVSRLAEGITSFTNELLDRVAGRSQMDVMDDLAFPLPLRVMADVLGLPLQDEERYAAWSQAINGEEMPELRAYFHELLTERL